MQKISKKHPYRVNTIQTDCVITPFFERKKGVLVSGCEVESTVWDTGATNTIISTAVFDSLGLKPVRHTVCVIFSPNVFAKMGLENCDSYMSNQVSLKDFRKWLIKSCTKDLEMQKKI